MSVIHMDTDQVLSVQKALAQAGNEISNEVHLMSNSISNIPWQGASHDEFIMDFENLSRSLLDRGDSLLILASRIEREIARWMDMDSKFGTGAAIGIGVGAPAVMTMALNAGESPQEPVYSTMAVGEEGQAPGDIGRASSMAVGEEGQAPGDGGGASTMAVGEEGQAPGDVGRVTTLAVGEEGQGLHPIQFTRPLNEEGQSVSMLTAEEGQAPGDGGGASTMAVGEEGQAPGDGGRYTSLAVGEEGQTPGDIGWVKPDQPIVTAELGEEGLNGKLPSMPDFTHDFGEEGYNARLMQQE